MTKKAFSLKIDEELLDKVRKQAKKEIRSVNNFIESVLQNYIDDVDKKEGIAKDP